MARRRSTYRLTARRRAALKKAQLASARKRSRGGVNKGHIAAGILAAGVIGVGTHALVTGSRIHAKTGRNTSIVDGRNLGSGIRRGGGAGVVIAHGNRSLYLRYGKAIAVSGRKVTANTDHSGYKSNSINDAFTAMRQGKGTSPGSAPSRVVGSKYHRRPRSEPRRRSVTYSGVTNHYAREIMSELGANVVFGERKRA